MSCCHHSLCCNFISVVNVLLKALLCQSLTFALALFLEQQQQMLCFGWSSKGLCFAQPRAGAAVIHVLQYFCAGSTQVQTRWLRGAFSLQGAEPWVTQTPIPILSCSRLVPAQSRTARHFGTHFTA